MEIPTAIAAFVGYTEKSVDQGKSLEMKPVRIRSLSQYVEYFGGPYKICKEDLIPLSCPDDDPQVPTMKIRKTFFLYEAVRQFYENGGEECYILSVGHYANTVILGDGSAAQTAGLGGGLKQLEYLDRPTLLAIPDAVLLTSTDYFRLIQMGLAHCKKMGTRFFIIDLPEQDSTPDSWVSAIHQFQQQIGDLNLEYGAAYTPWQNSTRPFIFHATLIQHHLADQALLPASQQTSPSGSENNALTFPPRAIAAWKKAFSRTPPSGSVLGVLVASDKAEGVWKTPSGLPLKGVSGPALSITSEMQTLLAGKVTINAIRHFAGKGTLLWGFHTLNGMDPDWRYIPTMRMTQLITRALNLITARVTSLPNVETTWSMVRSHALDYLDGLWQAGAFSGNKPQLAYYAKIGLGETMNAQDVSTGMMKLEVGIAPLRPAEFIHLRITQQLRPT
jgi:phage tail sheath protein FI